MVRAWSFCGAWVSVIEAESVSVRDWVGGRNKELECSPVPVYYFQELYITFRILVLPIKSFPFHPYIGPTDKELYKCWCGQSSMIGFI